MFNSSIVAACHDIIKHTAQAKHDFPLSKVTQLNLPAQLVLHSAIPFPSPEGGAPGFDYHLSSAGNYVLHISSFSATIDGVLVAFNNIDVSSGTCFIGSCDFGFDSGQGTYLGGLP